MKSFITPTILPRVPIAVLVACVLGRGITLSPSRTPLLPCLLNHQLTPFAPTCFLRHRWRSGICSLRRPFLRQWQTARCGKTLWCALCVRWFSLTSPRCLRRTTAAAAQTLRWLPSVGCGVDVVLVVLREPLPRTLPPAPLCFALCFAQSRQTL